MSSIHGHQVLEMMIESQIRYTKPSLIATIEQRFGAEARFHTCSANGLTAAELVDFLEKRGKFIAATDGFTTDKSNICSH